MTRKIALIAAFLLVAGCLNETNPNGVRTFQDCVSAGYNVTDSAPRQCKTPDGRTITSDQDIFDATRDVTCGDDSECALVNGKNGFSCCYIGRCEQADYSRGEWQAVNKDWFDRERTRNCPKDCGPAPACPTKQPLGAYKPACINSRCIKLQAV